MASGSPRLSSSSTAPRTDYGYAYRAWRFTQALGRLS
jgi:hypothetical protein